MNENPLLTQRLTKFGRAEKLDSKSKPNSRKSKSARLGALIFAAGAATGSIAMHISDNYNNKPDCKIPARIIGGDLGAVQSELQGSKTSLYKSDGVTPDLTPSAVVNPDDIAKISNADPNICLQLGGTVVPKSVVNSNSARQ